MDLMLSNIIIDQPKESEKQTKQDLYGGKGNGKCAGFPMVFGKLLQHNAVVVKKRNVEKLSTRNALGTAKATIAMNGIKETGTKLSKYFATETTNGIIAQAKKKQINRKNTFNPNGVFKTVSSILNSTGQNGNNGKEESPDKCVNSKFDCKEVTRNHIKKQTMNAGANEKSGYDYGEKINVFRFNGKEASRNQACRTSFDRLKPELPKIELPLVKPLEEQVFSEQAIETLAIHPHTKKNIVDLLEYTHLTMVQSMAIPRLMNGRDALIRAQTGSGKTLAYALPMIEQLHKIRPKISRTEGILAVIIVPTRELALQTYELMLKLLKPYTWIVSGFLCGGEKRKTEKARLRAGLNILIGTPGRFCDHIRNTESLKLRKVRWLILDEADRLLELGYEKDVKEIVGAIQAGRNGTEETDNNKALKKESSSLQTVLLSATLTASVKELAGLTLRNPEYVETSDIIRKRQAVSETADGMVESSDHLLNVDECVSIPSTVKQRYIIIPPKLRLITLSGLISRAQHEHPSKVLVFMATQDLVDFHYDVMVEILTTKQLDSDDENEDEDEDEELNDSVLLPNVSFFKLHGGMTQIERSAVFQRFRKVKAGVLLCTDMVARGIDVPSVDLVVQYHAPQMLTDYVHRVGRTGRAGQIGTAVLFIEPAEIDFIKYLAAKQIRIVEQKIDGIFVHLGQRLKCGQKTVAKNKEQAAISLQARFEQLIRKEKQLYSSACKAYVSWVRYYSNFPRELRNMFAIKAVHMGHHAQGLGLRDAPKKFIHNHTLPKDAVKRETTDVAGRGHGDHRNQQHHTGRGVGHRKIGAPRQAGEDGQYTHSGHMMANYAKRSRVLTMSEFDSGMKPARKKVKV